MTTWLPPAERSTASRTPLLTLIEHVEVLSGAAVAHVLITPVSASSLDAQTSGVGVGAGVIVGAGVNVAGWLWVGGAPWKPIPPVMSQALTPNTATKPASHAKSLDRLG